jgi:hypothetical protein
MGNIIILRKIFPDQHGMARLQAAHRADGVHIWITDSNILNTSSRTADKRWSFNLMVGRGANNYSPQNLTCYEM